MNAQHQVLLINDIRGPEKMTTIVQLDYPKAGNMPIYTLIVLQGKLPNASIVYIQDDITYAMSTLAVASSMTSTLSLRRIALARQ